MEKLNGYLHLYYLGGSSFLTSIFEFGNGIVGSYTVSYGIDKQDKFEIVGKNKKLKLKVKLKIIKDIKKNFEDFYNVLVYNKENKLGNPIEALKDLAFFEAVVQSNGTKFNLSTLL